MPSPRALWRAVAVLLLLAAIAVYVLWHRDGAFAHGGSLYGLVVGSAAFVLILLLLFFGIRKRMYRSRRLGSLESWLQSHVWLGILSLPLVLLHAGFRFHDRVAVSTLVLLVLVVATGVVGAVLYTTLPRVLTEVSTNVPPEETAADLRRLELSMGRLAEGKSRIFAGIHRSLLSEARPGPLAGWRILLGRPPRLRAEPGAWAGQLKLVPPEEQEDLKEMLVLSRQHKEAHQRLVLEQRYKNLLAAWLYLHVPLSLALLVLATVHAVAALYYRGLPWGALLPGAFGGGG